MRKPRPVRYEKTAPGDLIHVDIKKLGRILDGGAGASTAEASPMTAQHTRDVTRPPEQERGLARLLSLTKPRTIRVRGYGPLKTIIWSW